MHHFFWDSYVLMRLYILVLLGVLVTGLHGQRLMRTLTLYAGCCREHELPQSQWALIQADRYVYSMLRSLLTFGPGERWSLSFWLRWQMHSLRL